MERSKTTKNIGQPCVICGQPANAQATVEALQARNSFLESQNSNLSDSLSTVLALKCELDKQVEALQRERDEAKASRDMWKREAYLIGDALRPLCGLSEYEFGWKLAVKLIADKLAALDAEREKVKELEQQVQDQSTSNLEIMRHTDDMQSRALDAERALTQLQALVRALPVVRIDLNGAYHDTLLARPEDDAVKELLRYRATLSATTPDSNQLGAINDMVSKGGNGE